MTMTTLYDVWHIYEPDPHGDVEEEKFLGVYSSKEKAQAEVDYLRAQPGFRDWPDCFRIDSLTVDEMLWTEGFVSSLPGKQ
jgi:hypothetical protein